ncbi:sigma-70 family RNA polymerase sigma factor [Zunongwangia sp. SCSIO 43204]|uniref:RNA polymerase sigma factor n=1 Tax=Zunongwangia sp. SCSIO 43204 TaxID=2779359 RepID=UPI001CA9BBE0|nr:sigma-70 family RNA polymerase sigma factor [Zunongwangia sp. SCSIO 43204]UAB86133.1 sigma-70 family RNA polymerase sigma factor [Zunongwangia sp. SCSIO 43204]
MFFKKSNKVVVKDDQHAWECLKAGETEALGYFYDKYVDSLIAYGFYLNLDKAKTKDCIHDIFLDIFKYRESISGVSNTKSYLISCFRRKVFKDKKHLRIIHIGENNPDIIHTQIEAEQPVENKIIHLESESQQFSHFNSALSALTDYQTRVLEMKFKENKSYTEIAEELNISVESVRTQLYRILKKLRKTAIVLIACLEFIL